MDIGSIAAAATSIRTIADIIKTLSKMKSIPEVQTAIIELRNEIISAQSNALVAQSEQATMIQKISDFEKEITNIKAWEKEKQRYQLVSPWNGCVVYALKEQCKKTEPPHWICTKCYEDGRKSILNQHRKHSAFIEFICPVCKTMIQPLNRHSQGFPVDFAETYLEHNQSSLSD